MNRTRTAALALTVTALLALSACGNDSGSTPEASASATPDRTTCPTTATEIPAVAAVVAANQDLAVKPKVVKGPTPAPSVISYFDLVKGTGDEVRTGSYVKLKYVGALYANGKEFDSSWKTSATTTIDIRACYDGTVTGFAVGSTGMKVGGRRQIEIPASFGYGATGQPPVIGKNADLIFIVDLVATSVTPFPVEPVPTAAPTVAPTAAPTGSAPTPTPATTPTAAVTTTPPAATTAPAATPTK